MRRRLLIVLLAMGTIGGYASGFASLSRHHRYRCHGGSWGERWDSRGPRESWESSRAPRWSAPSVAAPSPAPTAEGPARSPEPR